jgi:hypothetical protein
VIRHHTARSSAWFAGLFASGRQYRGSAARDDLRRSPAWVLLGWADLWVMLALAIATSAGVSLAHLADRAGKSS